LPFSTQITTQAAMIVGSKASNAGILGTVIM
jgi:hypothetical protein